MTTRRMLLLALVALTVMLFGIAVGSVSLSPGELLAGLREAGSTNGLILWHLRVPRVLLAFLVGGGLGVTGAALQALVRNPLADPYLLGLSGGAGLGAVAAIALNTGATWAVPLAAFIGALAAVALVYRLAVVSGRRLDPRVLLLAGVVVGAFAGAIMSAIIVLSDAPRLRNAIVWLLGGLGSASWDALLLLAAYSAVPLAVLWYVARQLDLLALGDETAAHLGADPERLKRIVYLSASLLTAASVATCGIIGFVGLVIPHAVRRAWTPLHRVLVPASFLAGGAFLVLADALARTAMRPLELPVGVVTALVGVPLFALLLRRTLTA
ncbi:MAG TPA: iron ABC transporter permease [Gemmatimonadales bacterium]|nr:iron ABC transporter permease [Gemmatimonadales bacterium]